MRIISGIFKGRNLRTPSVKDAVRPTTDRARETLFNILTSRFNFDGKKCLDLFCGTGSFGIEFISRGGQECKFVDLDIRVVKQNIGLLNLSSECSVIRNEAVKFLQINKEEKFDFVFADPPYKFSNYGKLLDAVSGISLIFILEHDKSFIVPDGYKDNLFLHKKIGISQFSFFDFK
jgi:16S rRNA (guanine966-N2)-methyltransferase